MNLQRGDEIQVLDRNGHYLFDGMVTGINPNRKRNVHYIRPNGYVGVVKSTQVIKTGKRYRFDAVLEDEMKKAYVQLQLDDSELKAARKKAEELKNLLKEASSLQKELANTEVKIKVTLPSKRS